MAASLLLQAISRRSEVGGEERSGPNREILKTRERINGIIAERTGQSVDRVGEDTQRDYWMSAEESVEYGLVGKIISDIGEVG